MAITDPALAAESPLKESELDQAEALVREAGWNQTADDWKIFFNLGSVLAVRNSDGRLVATAAMVPYGKDFAWISMVLVMKEYRRQGLARRLLDRCVSDIQAKGMIPILDATPAGRAVYIGMGFRDTWKFQRLSHGNWRANEQSAAKPAGVSIRPITDAEWPELCSYDAQTFGADRSAVLGRLRGRMPGAEFVAYRSERIAGFLLGRDGQSATQLGPLVAEDEATAQALLDCGLGAIEGAVYIDLSDTKAALHASLLKRGFEVQRPFTRMVFGRDQAFDDPARTFAVAGPELG